MSNSTVGPLYLCFLHPWSQPTMDRIYFLKNSTTIIYTVFIYIVLGIIGNLEMTKYMRGGTQVMCNATPFYIRDLGILEFGIHGRLWSQFPADTRGQLHRNKS